LGNKEHVSPIGCRLYLPENWVNDKQRCLEAGVPEEDIEFYRKQDLALQLVIQARAQGVEFGWVGGDSFYGKEFDPLTSCTDIVAILSSYQNGLLSR
jgi:SRSO17 transposase